MWKVERNYNCPVGPYRWHWTWINTAYGVAWGNAWTKNQAYKRLEKAQSRIITNG